MGTKKLCRDEAKMALSWPTWRQDVFKMAKLEPKMSNLAQFGEHIGDVFLDLGGDLAETCENQKTTIVKHF